MDTVEQMYGKMKHNPNDLHRWNRSVTFRHNVPQCSVSFKVCSTKKSDTI